MNRRRRAGPGIVTIYWRDIPAQVTATTPAGDTEKVLLAKRFQNAIDRAAGVAGLTDAHSYVEQWRRVEAEFDDGPDGDTAGHRTATERLAADIEAEYPRDRLESLVAAGGLDPDTGTGT